MCDTTHKMLKAKFHNKDFIKATHQANRFVNNKTQLSIEEITLITLFNKHCNTVDYSLKPV